jgi:hypothetical protein
MQDDPHKGEVGYCKPPKASQFKKGKSGNPSGRPKRPCLNIVDLIVATMSEPQFVKTSSGHKKMYPLHIMIKTHVNAAMKGNIRAFNLLAKLTDNFRNGNPDGDKDQRRRLIQAVRDRAGTWLQEHNKD